MSFLDDTIQQIRSTLKADREIDGRLARMLGYKLIEDKWTAPEHRPPIKSLPRFTANVDAAMWFLDQCTGGRTPPVYGVSWETNEASATVGEGNYVIAPTPALALCLATLAYLKLNITVSGADDAAVSGADQAADAL